MRPKIPRRSLLLFLTLGVVCWPEWSVAATEAYRQAYLQYESGDDRAAVAVLERGCSGEPDQALLLGLARLRLDEPAKAAAAWAQFIRTSKDSRLAAEIARLRTIVVRAANQRAAKAARAATTAPPVSHEVLAVLPFRNVGSAAHAPLGEAIAAMLGESLSAIPTARVLGRGRVGAFLKGAEGGGSGDRVARRVGEMLGAGMVVVGAYVDTSTDPMTLEVTSALIDTATGRRLEGGSYLAPLERFYTAVRDTAVSISTRLGWPVSALPVASAARLQAVHTESLEAALAFGRGLDRQDRADFDGARRAYQSALRADPSFALARRQLATLPATLMSLRAIATAVQSELPRVEPPTVVALAPTATPEPQPSVSHPVQPAPTARSAEGAAAAVAGAASAAAGGGAGHGVGRGAGAAAAVARAAGAAEGRRAGHGVGRSAGAAASSGASKGVDRGVGAAAGGGASQGVDRGVGAASGEEETTILGMSPMTAALVGGGVAIAIGGAAAALGGGGGGGGGGDNPPVRRPELRGVEDRTVSAGGLIVLNIEG